MRGRGDAEDTEEHRERFENSVPSASPWLEWSERDRTMATQTSNKELETPHRSTLIAVAWIGTLLLSPLVDIVWREGFSGEPSQALYARVAFSLILLVLSIVWKAARPLRGYFFIFLVVHVLYGFVLPLIEGSGIWLRWFGPDAPWFWSNIGTHSLRLLVALAVWAVLAAMGLKRRDYYLVRGQLDAPVEPVRWLGIRGRDRWTRFGAILAVIISALLLLSLISGARPSPGDLVYALPWLPAVLLFAAINAFNEEFPYRAALLSQLVPTVGKQHALLLTAALFGLGHFYGVPPGVAGVLMAGLLGWLLGKSIVETRGLFWAWFIHFLQDILIFTFMAMAAAAA